MVRPTPPPRQQLGGGLRAAVAACQLLALLLFALAAQAIVFGGLVQLRAQHLAYTQLRNELALATAPVAQTDGNGHLLAPGAPVAVLDVPELGLHQVVLEGTTSGILEKGPGHRRDTVLPGQAGDSVIYGRRAAYGGPFSDIDRLQPGAVINVTTGQGRSVFRVIDVRRAGDPVPSFLGPSQGRVTLVTATGSPFMPSGVLRVDADLVGNAQPTPARVFGGDALSAAEQPLAGDSQAWVPLVLYGQFLVAAALAFVWARYRWGARQAWLVGLPVLLFLGFCVADSVLRLLPNLL